MYLFTVVAASASASFIYITVTTTLWHTKYVPWHSGVAATSSESDSLVFTRLSEPDYSTLYSGDEDWGWATSGASVSVGANANGTTGTTNSVHAVNASSEYLLASPTKYQQSEVEDLPTTRDDSLGPFSLTTLFYIQPYPPVTATNSISGVGGVTLVEADSYSISYTAAYSTELEETESPRSETHPALSQHTESADWPILDSSMPRQLLSLPCESIPSPLLHFPVDHWSHTGIISSSQPPQSSDLKSHSDSEQGPTSGEPGVARSGDLSFSSHALFVDATIYSYPANPHRPTFRKLPRSTSRRTTGRTQVSPALKYNHFVTGNASRQTYHYSARTAYSERARPTMANSPSSPTAIGAAAVLLSFLVLLF